MKENLKLTDSQFKRMSYLPPALQRAYHAKLSGIGPNESFQMNAYDMYELLSLYESLQRQVEDLTANRDHLLIHSGRVEI